MSDWRENKLWSDRFLPEIKRILGAYLIGEAPQQEDAERNTDLIVLRMEPVRIACRVRRTKYMQDYGDEFTIRSDLPSGTKTELAKIIEGYGDYLFYGFGDDKNNRLTAYTLADLRIFRVAFMHKLAKLEADTLPGRFKKNHDGSSSFRVFRWSEFPSEMIVAQKPCAGSLN